MTAERAFVPPAHRGWRLDESRSRVTAPTISVVIPTKGRPAILMKALRSVADQGEYVREVIVVDGTKERADEAALRSALAGAPTAPVLVYCWAPADNGLPAARNRGVRVAQGDVIQFMDDDTTVEPHYFAHLQAAFAAPEVGGVGGLLIDPVADSRRLRAWFFRVVYVGPFRQDKDELYLRPPKVLTPSNTLPGASAYRREVFRDFQFDEALTGPAVGEDLDFSFRVGQQWSLVIEPRARMFHHRSPQERSTSRRAFADKVVFFHYHFRKNMRGSAADWVAFAWLNVGFFVDAAVRLHPQPVRGVLDGYRRIARAGLFFRPAAHRP